MGKHSLQAAPADVTGEKLNSGFHKYVPIEKGLSKLKCRNPNAK